MTRKFYWPSLLFTLSVAFLAPSACAAERPAEIVRGPVFSGTIKAKFPGDNVTMKGIVITVGDGKGYVCYDTDLLRVSLGWTGDFLEFGNSQTQIQHPQPPSVKGTPVFGSKAEPGWAKGGTFADPRLQKQGPLPKDWAHYRGLYMSGNRVVLSYTVGECDVLEKPGLETWADGRTAFTRTLNVGKGKGPLTLLVAACAPETVLTVTAATADAPLQLEGAGVGRNETVSCQANSLPAGSRIFCQGGRLAVELPARKKATAIKLFISKRQGDEPRFQDPPAGKIEDLVALTKGGPPRWMPVIVTNGLLSTSTGPYVVDTISEGIANPWNAKSFFGGFDFFPDGRAAVCTFHGDVWIVSGLDAKLEKVTWKRFSTGMFQPLGLKIVEGKIHVTCRDQLTRLHDLNSDGEADFYENFNNDTVVTANYHEFCLDLHTDRAGNFYYAKGSPWPPNVGSPHQGVMLKVAKDGSSLEVFATGLRAPNGMTVGPHDEILVGDNQGHYMPSSKLSLVKKGGYYGMQPAAHRNPMPAGKASEEYDQPICWLPQSMDNSSGGQMYAPTDKWGALGGLALFMSYGKCTIFHVLTEEIDGVMQGGMVQLPLKFQSGLMRGRVNPRDGQVYVSGLRGWQTSGARDGGLYRVRYTGEPVRSPVKLHAARNGMQITFSCALEPVSVTDAANWSIEQWNYVYSGNYGSPEFSVSDPKKKGHDPVTIKAVKLSSDRRTVFVETDDLGPVMQMKIKFKLKAADGAPVAQEIFNTIHRLGARMAGGW